MKSKLFFTEVQTAEQGSKPHEEKQLERTTGTGDLNDTGDTNQCGPDRKWESEVSIKVKQEKHRLELTRGSVHLPRSF